MALNHLPVLKKEIIEAFGYLKEIDSPIFVDGTVGLGGHSIAIAHNLKAQSKKQKTNFKIIGIDRDEEAMKIAEANIKKTGLENNFILIHNSFKNIRTILKELNINKIDGALLDLGVSSLQLDRKERGFSFRDREMKLDMRMDQNQEKTAAFILNNYPEKDLARIIREYGEERFAGKIAKEIIKRRKITQFLTVGQLLDMIILTIPSRKREKIHPATRTFQAIRIEVNEELDNLDMAIRDFVEHLKEDRKMAVISFHSLEDRIVKQTFANLANPCHCPSEMPCVCGKKPEINILTKKPVVPEEAEIRDNPRSRSAKLRSIQRVEQ